MKNTEKGEKVTVRISVSDKKALDGIITEGKFETYSQIIRQALRQFLMKYRNDQDSGCG